MSKPASSGVGLSLLERPVTSRVMKAMSASQGPSAASASSAVRKTRPPAGTAASIREPHVLNAWAESSRVSGRVMPAETSSGSQEFVPFLRIVFEILGSRVPHEDALGAIGQRAAVAALAAIDLLHQLGIEVFLVVVDRREVADLRLARAGIAFHPVVQPFVAGVEVLGLGGDAVAVAPGAIAFLGNRVVHRDALAGDLDDHRPPGIGDPDLLGGHQVHQLAISLPHGAEVAFLLLLLEEGCNGIDFLL